MKIVSVCSLMVSSKGTMQLFYLMDPPAVVKLTRTFFYMQDGWGRRATWNHGSISPGHT